MNDMKKPNPSRSRIIALPLAAAVAFAPTMSYAAEEEGGFFSSLKKGLSDIGTGIKQGVEQELGGKSFGEKVGEGVEAGLSGKTPQPVGHVNLGGGGYVTYFDNSTRGFSSRGAPLTTPPKAGTVPDISLLMQTGKFTGQIVDNNIETMKKMGVFVATQPYLPPGGVPPQTEARATVPVHTYTDPATGQIWSNAPDDCRIIVVSDAKGNEIKRRYLSRPQDYDLAAACDVARSAATRERIKPAAARAD